MAEKVFEGVLQNGVKYEIHTASGFSDRAEVAIMVDGRPMSILMVEVKRNGNIACQPLQAKFDLIKKEEEEKAQAEVVPNLDDVISPESTDTQPPNNPKSQE